MSRDELAGIEQAVRQPAVAGPSRGLAGDPETGKAIGLAAAAWRANLVAVVFTVIFTRILGADGYGSLAALLNLTRDPVRPGSALQVAAAREGTLGRLGRGGELAGTLARWSRHILIGLAAVAVVVRRSRASRSPPLLNVDQEWAAAAVPVTGVPVAAAVPRSAGCCRSARAYRAVGLSVVFEALGRLVRRRSCSSPPGSASPAPTSARWPRIAVDRDRRSRGVLRRRLGPPDARRAPPPAARARARRRAADRRADARRRAPERRRDHGQATCSTTRVAGVYAAARWPPRRVVWIAVGLGILGAAGGDPPRRRGPRPARRARCARSRVIGALVGVRAGGLRRRAGLLLRTAFGAGVRVRRRPCCCTLGAAYALLAVTYIGVQFLLGLRHARFAPARSRSWRSPSRCCSPARTTCDAFAGVVLAVQAVGAVLMLAVAARPARPLRGRARRARSAGAASRRRVIARAAIVVAAVLIAAWLVSGLIPRPRRARGHRRRARDAAGPAARLPAAGAGGRPHAARREPDLRLAQLDALDQAPRPRRRAACAIVTRREPENFDAWRLLASDRPHGRPGSRRPSAARALARSARRFRADR